MNKLLPNCIAWRGTHSKNKSSSFLLKQGNGTFIICMRTSSKNTRYIPRGEHFLRRIHLTRLMYIPNGSISPSCLHQTIRDIS